MDIQHTLNTYGLAGLGAALAVVAAGWSRVKSAFQYVSGFVVLQKHTDTVIATAVSRHVRLHYKRLQSGVSRFHGRMAQVDDHAILTPVPFDMPKQTSLWWGRRGVFIIHNDHTQIDITCLRWLSDPYKMVEDAINERMETSQSQLSVDRNFYVKRVMGTAGESMSAAFGNEPRRKPVGVNSASDSDDSELPAENSVGDPMLGVDESWMFAKERYIQNKKTHDPMRGLFFPKQVHDALEAARTWFKRRQWYQDHGIPWRTGFLFHGVGGTGKSSMARVMAQTLGLPLYQYYLNTLTDREFVDHWENMNTPCIVALEDFDTVFHGRESVTVHKSLSFECVLNQISGISSLNGVLLVVTTNHLEHIDAAMGQVDEQGRPTRPGRIDHILHFGVTTPEQRWDIARYVLDGWTDEHLESIVAGGAEATAAQFQNRCIQLALEQLATGKRSVDPSSHTP